MKGYNTLKEYIQDYRLYLAGKRIDPGRDSRETLTAFLKKRISYKLSNATKNFKKMIKKNEYTQEDLKFIAIHEVMGEICSIQEFSSLCFSSGQNISFYKKLLSTKAFQKGQLKKLYDYIPESINTKEDFISFLRTNPGLNFSELKAIMKYICKKDWQSWLSALKTENKLRLRMGRILNVF